MAKEKKVSKKSPDEEEVKNSGVVTGPSKVEHTEMEGSGTVDEKGDVQADETKVTARYIDQGDYFEMENGEKVPKTCDQLPIVSVGERKVAGSTVFYNVTTSDESTRDVEIIK